MGGRHAPREQTDAAIAALDRADRGEVAIDGRFGGVDWGVVEFALGDGWRVWVFNDGGDWDYIDRVRSPEGWEIEFDLAPSRLRNWQPKSPGRWGKADLLEHVTEAMRRIMRLGVRR